MEPVQIALVNDSLPDTKGTQQGISVINIWFQITISKLFPFPSHVREHKPRKHSKPEKKNRFYPILADLLQVSGNPVCNKCP